MTDEPAPDWVTRAGKALASLANSASLYGAASLAGGPILVALHRPLGLSAYVAFPLGVFAAMGLVYLVYASDRGMRQTLGKFKSLREADLIDDEDYQKLKSKALTWYQKKRW
jgi:hypothetical protein